MARASSLQFSPFGPTTVKYELSYNTWAVLVTSPNNLIVSGITTDANGNVYVAGTSDANTRAVIMKLNRGGQVQWAMRSNTYVHVNCGGMDITPSGDRVFVAFNRNTIANSDPQALGNSHNIMHSLWTANGSTYDIGYNKVYSTKTTGAVKMMIGASGAYMEGGRSGVHFDGSNNLYTFGWSVDPNSTTTGFTGGVTLKYSNILTTTYAYPAWKMGFGSSNNRLMIATAGWVSNSGVSYAVPFARPNASEGKVLVSYSTAGAVAFSKIFTTTPSANVYHKTNAIVGDSGSNLYICGLHGNATSVVTTDSGFAMKANSTGGVVWSKKYTAFEALTGASVPSGNSTYVYFAGINGHLGRLNSSDGTVDWCKRQVFASDLQVIHTSNDYLYFAGGVTGNTRILIKANLDGSDLPVGNTQVTATANLWIQTVTPTVTNIALNSVNITNTFSGSATGIELATEAVSFANVTANSVTDRLRLS